jgi:PEP-CTERM motif-containing protein
MGNKKVLRFNNKLLILFGALVLSLMNIAPSEAGIIFNNWNTGGVIQGNPTADTIFTIGESMVIHSIANYHWNYPGHSDAYVMDKTIGIEGTGGSGGWVLLGEWDVNATSGAIGATNVNWWSYPGVTLAAGTYRVYDSDPGTWSHNSQSGNRGFSQINADPPSAVPEPATMLLLGSGVIGLFGFRRKRADRSRS